MFMASHYITFHLPGIDNLFVIAIRLKVKYRFNVDTVLFFTLYKNMTALKVIYFYICWHA
jgi:hypothetical protein